MKTQIIQRSRFALRKVAGKATAVSVVMIGGTTAAMASDGGSAASAAFSELSSQATSMAGEAWPIVTGVVGSLLAIGLFKKFANKAT